MQFSFLRYSIFILFFEQEIGYHHIWDLIRSFQEKSAFLTLEVCVLMTLTHISLGLFKFTARF